MRRQERIKGASDWIIGWTAISRRLGCGKNTAVRYAERHGLPVARLPDGRRVLTEQHLHQWLLARVPGIEEALRRHE